jgi:hypothetical protein
MERFRIKQHDQIIILARYKGELIEKQTFFGYTRLKDIKIRFLDCLDYQFKNKGIRIELTFWNVQTDDYKFINCFS